MCKQGYAYEMHIQRDALGTKGEKACLVFDKVRKFLSCYHIISILAECFRDISTIAKQQGKQSSESLVSTASYLNLDLCIGLAD